MAFFRGSGADVAIHNLESRQKIPLRNLLKFCIVDCHEILRISCNDAR
ncbi:hypothetical protein [Helicobacter sp. MIT 05-5294]|nr:hypothetical protein [Helicobacter sp. MIT 05-5294]